MEALKSFPDNSYDLAIVDPPYGINAGKKHVGPGWVTRESKSWDFERPGINYFSELRRVSKNQIIWGGNYFADLLPASMGWIFWDKGQRNFSLADGELAWTSFNRALRVFEFSRAKCMAEVNGHKIHPTQKPIALYKWLLLNYTGGGGRTNIRYALRKRKYSNSRRRYGLQINWYRVRPGILRSS